MLVLRTHEDKAFEMNHRHFVDHATLVVSGRVTRQLEGEPDHDFGAMEWFNVPAEQVHRIVARTPDAKWVCIFSEGEVYKKWAEKVIRWAEENGIPVPDFGDKAEVFKGHFSELKDT